MKVLYLGLEVPPHLSSKDVLHFPLISIHPKKNDDPFVVKAMKGVAAYTHILFTSKSAIAIFFDYLAFFKIVRDELKGKKFIVVGTRSAEKLKAHGIEADYIAKDERAEGIIEILQGLSLEKAYLFWPHSSLSRSLIPNWLDDQGIKYRDCVFYDTHLERPKDLPCLDIVQEIVFTSPSTIDAFLLCYRSIPQDKILTCQGEVTEKYLSMFKL